MFGTSIHWTTFFFLLTEIFIILFIYIRSKRLKVSIPLRFIQLGLLFILYNFSGGLLPTSNFPGPFIVQYIITYVVAITMCLNVGFYLYKEHDIDFLKFKLNISNIGYLVYSCFIFLFLLPFYLTESIALARLYFSIPVSAICFFISWDFYRRISKPKNPNRFIIRRNRLSLISIICISLLPVLTILGDYQWVTFTVINLAFFCITAVEVDRYLYYLENKNKLSEVLDYYSKTKINPYSSSLTKNNLTRREMEIAMFVMNNNNYKGIAEELFIAESTVSKHASNIFKKTGVKNRSEFLKRFKKGR